MGSVKAAETAARTEVQLIKASCCCVQILCETVGKVVITVFVVFKKHNKALKYGNTVYLIENGLKITSV